MVAAETRTERIVAIRAIGARRSRERKKKRQWKVKERKKTVYGAEYTEKPESRGDEGTDPR
jgi:hypothetical protein